MNPPSLRVDFCFLPPSAFTNLKTLLYHHPLYYYILYYYKSTNLNGYIIYYNQSILYRIPFPTTFSYSIYFIFTGFTHNDVLLRP